MATDHAPGPNEMHCPECGKITPRGGVVCGHCGAPIYGGGQKRMTPAKWEKWGKTAAGLSYFFTPILFGPIAFYCGMKLRRYDEEAGMKIVGYAIGAVVLYSILVALVV